MLTPVAVIIARVKWLLAMSDIVAQRTSEIHVPAFLGNSLQWSVQDLAGQTYVEVPVPDEPPLRVQAGLCTGPGQV